MHFQAALFKSMGEGGIIDAIAVNISDQESKVIVAI